MKHDLETRRHKAFSHPLRASILRRLADRVASPGELAAELGASLGVVSYHVRMLRDYGMVELVRMEPRRGALQHYYRAVEHPQPEEFTIRDAVAQLIGATPEEVTVDTRSDELADYFVIHATVQRAGA